VGRQYHERALIRDAQYVLEFLQFLLATLVSSVRPRHDLVVENLLLWHQLAVLRRPTRTRPRARVHLVGQAIGTRRRSRCRLAVPVYP
jgi:hypothetical protein